MVQKSSDNPSMVIWRHFLESQPAHHLLQRPEWAALKSKFGWKSECIIQGNVGTQVLFRSLPLGFSIAYLPKGPIGPIDLWADLFPHLDALCKKNRSIFLKIEPDAWDHQQKDYDQILNGYAKHAGSIQPRRTIVIDLTGSQEDWFAAMKQKTRYNIRLAEKKEIVVSESSDVETFQKLMEVTGARNEFGVHNFEYYRRAFQLMSPNHCSILQASYQNIPVAAIMVFFTGKRAWYFYGASSDLERNRMPTYLLQFEAMKWAAAHQCTEYDLWGVPDFTEDQLEAQFSDRSDGLWGVYRFKRGFGGKVKRSVGAYDRVYMPLLYKIYQRTTKGDSA